MSSRRSVLGLLAGLASAAAAVVLYYSLPVRHSQVWVAGFHVHHLYFGIATMLLSLPLWAKNHRSIALFFLGIGLVITADGVRWLLA